MVNEKRTLPGLKARENEEQEMVEITCPKCSYSKTIPQKNIPAGLRLVRCPRCNNLFDYLLKKSDPLSGKDAQPSEEREDRIESPWENRDKIGTLHGIFDTFKLVLFSPRIFFSSVTCSGGIMEPFAYGLLMGSIGPMFVFFWQFLFEFTGLRFPGSALPVHISGDLASTALLITIPLICILMMFITGIAAHLCLMAVGGGGKGFEGTFRVLAFSQSAQALGVIPFVGGVMGSLWNIITIIVGLKEIHETSYVRVMVAILIPVALIILLVLIFTVLSVSYLL